MSAQFGRWNRDGRAVDHVYLEKAGKLVAPYGPDGQGAYVKDGVGILFHAFHTTKESRQETQPHVCPSGTVLTWDGRLDNRSELIGKLADALNANPTDVFIVAAAYQAWGRDCFAKLIGDWALSIWNPKNRSLLLAKDHIGAHHLYYMVDDTGIIWCSILEPMVILAGKPLSLDEEYIAGWFAEFPETHLTPYMGIHAVPPSSLVLIQEGKQTISRYWDFDPNKRLHYRTDAEYEEHFREVFTQAIRRVLRSDTPVLAELSGGIDSSSIVCVADTIIANGLAETPRLDTVSYYDDSEPDWNERPYFTRVEEKRGRTGCHIDVAAQEALRFDCDINHFAATPGSAWKPGEASKLYAACIKSQGNRVLLSGVGGDEVTGGVPSPIPELSDLLTTFRWKTLAHQLKVWALSKRKPWFHLLLETLAGFLPPDSTSAERAMKTVPWLHPQFATCHTAALNGYAARTRFLSSLPSFQDNLSTIRALRRSLSCSPCPSEPCFEKRYPYLDRDFLEFLFAVPPEQQLRPSQRRSLMRRALAEVVPPEVLDRRRKAFLIHGHMVAFSEQRRRLLEQSGSMACVSHGFIDGGALQTALRESCQGADIPILGLLRTVAIERWLKSLEKWKILHPGEVQREKVKPSTTTRPVLLSFE